MKLFYTKHIAIALLLAASSVSAPSAAHSLKAANETVQMGNSSMAAKPDRDWNKLSGKQGKYVETWTLDGAQLNDLSFFHGIPAGSPLFRERDKKRDPLPKFTSETLIIEIPELLDRTFRTSRSAAQFSIGAVEPVNFLSRAGVGFTYEYVDDDQLTRKGVARAAIIDGKLYMTTFDAPRLSYYDKTIGSALSVINSMHLK